MNAFLREKTHVSVCVNQNCPSKLEWGRAALFVRTYMIFYQQAYRGLRIENAVFNASGSTTFIKEMVPIVVSSILKYRVSIENADYDTYNFKGTVYHRLRKNPDNDVVKRAFSLFEDIADAVNHKCVSTFFYA